MAADVNDLARARLDQHIEAFLMTTFPRRIQNDGGIIGREAFE